VVHDNFLILDVARRVIDALGAHDMRCDLEVNRDRKDSRSYRVSGEKLTAHTGYRSEMTPEAGAAEILAALRSGRYTDFDHPVYYNMPWLTLLLAVEERLGKTGPVF